MQLTREGVERMGKWKRWDGKIYWPQNGGKTQGAGNEISSAAQQLQLKHAHGINLEDATPEGSSLEHKSSERIRCGGETDEWSANQKWPRHDGWSDNLQLCGEVTRKKKIVQGERKNNKWKSGLNKLQQSRDHSGKMWGSENTLRKM